MRVSAGEVPAAAKGGPHGQSRRTTGEVHVLGSSTSTPCARSCVATTSAHARATSEENARRTTMKPSATKRSTSASSDFPKHRLVSGERWYSPNKGIGA